MGAALSTRPVSAGSTAPKICFRGTHRTAAPADTLQRLLRLAPLMGITRVANITGLDVIGIPVAAAYRPNSRNIAVSQGKGLDLAKVPDPLAPENLLKTSGRGIFLIRSFMDEVEIYPSKTGTEIKLIKHVHGPAVDGKEASQ